jgi:hypothetical protein
LLFVIVGLAEGRRTFRAAFPVWGMGVMAVGETSSGKRFLINHHNHDFRKFSMFWMF